VCRSRAALLAAALPPEAGPGRLRACARAFALAAGLEDRLRGEALDRDDSRLILAAGGVKLLPTHLLLLGRLAAAGDAGAPAEALAAAERARARVFLDGLARSRAALLAGAPPALREREQDLEARLRAIDKQARELLDRQASSPDPEFPRLLADRDADRRMAEEDLRSLAGEMERAAPAYAALKYPRPCSVEQARACLGPGEVALLYASGPERSAVLLVEGRPGPADQAGGLHVAELPGEEAFAPLVDDLTDPVTLRQPGPARERGEELYRLLVTPLEGRLRGRDLVVVPDGALCRLPFELLVGPDGRHLAESRRVRYAPSLTALHLTRQWDKKRQRPSRPLFAVGDPVFGPPDERLGEGPVAVASAGRGGLVDLAWREGRTRGEGDGFGRLAHTGEEVRAVARLLGAGPDSVLTGFGANLGNVRKAASDGRLGGARYVHLATHGVLGLGDGQQPALVLGLPGGKPASGEGDERLLKLEEVSGLRLNADLVVLSACRTGRGRLDPAEGVTGLARAFLAAGCRGVVCSLWEVDDQATARLMVRMYEGLQAGKPAAGALREARLALLREGLPPFSWAAFVLQGE
jgi:CHAT domain-containing protein